MANRYTTGVDSSKAKPIIISIAAVVVVLVGILAYLAIKANEDDRIAALKYNFNRYFPTTYDTPGELDGEADYDNDGVSNKDEVSMKTSILSADSDSDALADADEATYSTDPNTDDCDGDGIPDGIEILAGLDPYNLITDGVTKDADRQFTRVINFTEGSVTMTGTAHIYAATVDELTLNAITTNSGALSAPYEVYCGNGFESATITFNYSEDVNKMSGITSEDMQIYKFDPYLKSYDPIGGTVDTASHTVSYDLTGNGVFVLGAEKVIHKAAEAYESGQMNVHLLIDNSGSMYPKSVQSTSKENDVNFKRLKFAQNFVTALDNSVKFAISVFTYDFNTLCKFDADKSHVVAAISSIKTLGAGFDGTSVERALMEGLRSFGEETINERNVIILLTDGISTDTAGYRLSDIVTLAKAKNISINTISLGDEFDRELLQNIADYTGGKYYPISEANVLEGLYTTMIASMEEDIIDDDYDGKPDSYTLYDTGFNSDFNGFSFNNFKSKTNATLDFGMTMLARDWFRNTVAPSAENAEAKIGYTFEGSTIETSEPLRRVILQTMQSPWMRPENYLNFTIGGEVLKVNSGDAAESQGKGWSKIIIPYDEPGTGWTKAEILVPDHTISTIRTQYSENDYQMIRAIHYYESLRGTGKNFTLSSDREFDTVKSVLATGSPIVTRILWEDGSGSTLERYVLMTTLRRDLENPNIFKMKVYDVNSESPTTIVVNRTVRLTSTPINDYTYSAVWDGKPVSLTCFLTGTVGN